MYMPCGESGPYEPTLMPCSECEALMQRIEALEALLLGLERVSFSTEDGEGNTMTGTFVGEVTNG